MIYKYFLQNVNKNIPIISLSFSYFTNISTQMIAVISQIVVDTVQIF